MEPTLQNGPDGMPARPNVRLVIIDDHELLAATLAIALRMSGLDVETVAGPSAEDVVAVVRKRAPVLVLLDLDLGPPLGSGLDLIAPLMAAGGRVVMMTGVEERARLGACIEVGAVGIVSKKLGFNHLLEAVGRAVDGDETLGDVDRAGFLDDLRVHRQAFRQRVFPVAR
jgi:DNA-binding NarL/FixJ family response regulator